MSAVVPIPANLNGLGVVGEPKASTLLQAREQVHGGASGEIVTLMYPGKSEWVVVLPIRAPHTPVGM